MSLLTIRKIFRFEGRIGSISARKYEINHKEKPANRDACSDDIWVKIRGRGLL